MELTVRTASHQPIIPPANVDFGRLEKWQKKYTAVTGDDLDPDSALITAVNSDHIDVKQIESQIHQAKLTTHVSRGYCSNCQYMFEHWPDLGTDSWTDTVGRPCHTVELEAARQKGCKSCTFLLLKLENAGLLDTFRRIEKRLDLVGDTATSSISISNWASDQNQLLWINFPGKVARSSNASSAMPSKV
jgi:hypothetical protein